MKTIDVEDTFCFFKVHGNSMAPKIEDGDQILVNTSRTAADGDIALIVATKGRGKSKHISP